MLPPRLTHWLKHLQGLAATLAPRLARPGEALGSMTLGSIPLDSIPIPFGPGKLSPIALGAIASTGFIGLLLWDAKLLLAIAVGLGAMALVYPAQRWDWLGHLARLRPQLLSGQTGPQRWLVRCVASGGAAMVATYMGASIWQRSHDGWLVTCLLFQGVGLLALLGWTWSQRGERSPHADASLGFDEALAALAQPQPLGRLLAVRQLHRLSQQRRLSAEEERTASQALQLLLLQESEAAVREAALRSLAPSLMAPQRDAPRPAPRPAQRDAQIGSLGDQPPRPDQDA